MPTETKNSTAKASRSGSESSAARWLRSRLAQHHAGEEGAERERDAEQLAPSRRRCRARSRARDSVNSSREPVRATCVQQPGDDPRARRPASSATNSRDLAQRDGQRRASRLSPRQPARRVGVAAEHAGEAPAAAPAPAPWPGPRRSASRRRCGPFGVSSSVALLAARAAARPCWRPTAPGRTPARRRATSPSSMREPDAERGRDARSGRSRRARRCARTASRSSSEKCSPTPNISRMTPISASCGGELGVGDEARRERPDQRRRRAGSRPAAAAAAGRRAKPNDEGEHEADGDGGDQRRFVMHFPTLSLWRRPNGAARTAGGFVRFNCRQSVMP